MARRGVSAWLGKYWGGLGLALLLMAAVGGVAAYAQRPPAPPVVVFQPPPRPTPSPPPIAQIVVHVGGAVESPGVYRLPVGARVDDAIKSAGGALGEADLQHLNLAARLADGQQVTVPRRAVAVSSPVAAGPSPAPLSASSGLVNLNRASVPELDALPGVGPVTAQRIVAYREEHGPFVSIEQLKDAKLVNNAMFEKLKDHVSVD